MSILTKCHADTVIFRIDETQAAKAVTQQKSLDKNHDGQLTVAETRGHTLWTPNAECGITIQNGDDLALFRKLAQNRRVIHSTLGFENSGLTNWGAKNPKTTTEEWLVKLKVENRLHQPPLKTIQPWSDPDLGAIEVADVMMVDDKFRLLFNFDFGTDAYFGTLELGQTPDRMVLELGGYAFDLNATQPIAEIENLRQSYVEVLNYVLNTPIPGVPKLIRQACADRLEAMQFQWRKEVPAAESVETFARNERFEKWNASEAWYRCGTVNLQIDIGRPYVTEILSREPLTEEESAVLEQAILAVPRYVYQALGQYGGSRLEELDFRVLDDEHIRYNAKKDVLGYCDGRELAINRSLLNSDSRTLVGELVEVLAHELGHYILIPPEMESVGPDGDPTFLYRYSEEIRDRSDKRQFLGVSLYQMDSAAEFFAEAVLAYVSGEEDALPESGWGSLSRSELRRKQPEMYLAIKMLFEAKAYPGSTTYFRDESLEVLREMAQKPEFLSPQFPADRLVTEFFKIHDRMAAETP